MEIFDEKKTKLKTFYLKMIKDGTDVDIMAVDDRGNRIAILIGFRAGRGLISYNKAKEYLEDGGYDTKGLQFDSNGQLIMTAV